jgi:hypothetical protein
MIQYASLRPIDAQQWQNYSEHFEAMQNMLTAGFKCALTIRAIAYSFHLDEIDLDAVDRALEASIRAGLVEP